MGRRKKALGKSRENHEQGQTIESIEASVQKAKSGREEKNRNGGGKRGGQRLGKIMITVEQRCWAYRKKIDQKKSRRKGAEVRGTRSRKTIPGEKTGAAGGGSPGLKASIMGPRKNSRN